MSWDVVGDVDARRIKVYQSIVCLPKHRINDKVNP